MSKKNKSTKTKRALGALISPEDERDWILEKITSVNISKSTPLPKVLDHSPNLSGVYDQGIMPICAAVTAATCKEWQEHNNTKSANFSPMFVYNQRSNKPEEGMYGRNVMDILLKSGCCRAGFYSTNPFNIDQDVSSDAYADGKNYLISGYARVTTVDGLKEALYKYGPCYIAFPVYNYGAEFWKKPSSTSKILGGHAVTVVGYDDNRQAFKIRNSWGVIWNLGGYTWFPYNDFGMKWEIWSMVDGISPNNPPPEPKCKCVLL